MAELTNQLSQLQMEKVTRPPCPDRAGLPLRTHGRTLWTSQLPEAVGRPGTLVPRRAPLQTSPGAGRVRQCATGLAGLGAHTTWVAGVQDTITNSHELLARCLAMQQQQAAAGATSITQNQSDAWWMGGPPRAPPPDSLLCVPPEAGRRTAPHPQPHSSRHCWWRGAQCCLRAYPS